MNESQIVSFLLRREMSKSHSEMLHRLADLATRLTRVRARALESRRSSSHGKLKVRDYVTVGD